MSSAITPRVSEISEGEDIAETNQHRAPHNYLDTFYCPKLIIFNE